MNLLRHWTTRAALALIVAVILVGLASSFPADIAFLMAIDLGTWVEAVVAVYVVAQVTRIRPILLFLRTRLFGRRRSTRQIRVQRSTRHRPSDDGEPAAASPRLGAFDFRALRPHLGVMNSESFRRFIVHSGQTPARA